MAIVKFILDQIGYEYIANDHRYMFWYESSNEIVIVKKNPTKSCTLRYQIRTAHCLFNFQLFFRETYLFKNNEC